VFKRRKAARIAAEQQRARQEEARRRIEEDKRKEAEREEISRKAREKILAETEAAISANPDSRQYRLENAQSEVSIPGLNITQFTPVSKKRYVAFDLETTGLSTDYDCIVEIGAVRVEDGTITDEFHQLINPGVKMPAEASAVNHITDDMLSGQPMIHQVLPAFLAFVGDDTLAAHNAAFDIKFIAQACMQNRFRVPVSYFDTMSLARYWPESEDKKLTSLCAAAGIEVNNAHRALSDARAVADLIAATNIRRSAKANK
jgi:DNA polymerase III epsilon subunit family exonuclease